MQRYFFDLVMDQPGLRRDAVYDHSGREFSCLQAACDFADILALDLMMESEDDWQGWAVKVHDAEARPLFCAMVPLPEMAVAA